MYTSPKGRCFRTLLGLLSIAPYLYMRLPWMILINFPWPGPQSLAGMQYGRWILRPSDLTRQVPACLLEDKMGCVCEDLHL